MRYVQCWAVVLFFDLLTPKLAFAEEFGARFKKWLFGSEAQAATREQPAPELDRIVQTCMQCHDGSGAVRITVKDARSPLQYMMSGVQKNHPVGMKYDDYAATDPQRYIPRVLLDANIVLVNGEVTCISCHRLKEPQDLVDNIDARWAEIQKAPSDAKHCSASNEFTIRTGKAGLCLACHRM